MVSDSPIFNFLNGHPERLLRRQWAKDLQGRALKFSELRSSELSCGCLLGLIAHFYGDINAEKIFKKIRQTGIIHNSKTIGWFNDTMPFENVVELCKRAEI